MAKKAFISKGGQSFLSGKRASVQKRGIRGLTGTVKEQFQPVMVDGKYLNIPESKIYRALEDLKVDFRAQVPIGGGRVLGGALCDFILYDYNINLEFQGPFHEAEADFWRKVAREQAGFMVEYLYDTDLINIHRRLKEIMGMG